MCEGHCNDGDTFPMYRSVQFKSRSLLEPMDVCWLDLCVGGNPC